MYSIIKIVKRIIRKIISARSRQYIHWVRKNEGNIAAARLYLKYIVKNDGFVRVKPPNCEHTIKMRPNGPNLHAYSQIFYDREYDIEFSNPCLVIDAGAHIGLGSVFFANKYPNASIVSIEADPKNFDLLYENVSNYENITPLQRAIWGEKTSVNLKTGSTNTRSQVKKEGKSSREIKTTTVGSILGKSTCNRVDILKLDIEGAEVEVLSDPDGWGRSVNAVLVEPHDEIKPSSSSVIKSFSKKYNFDVRKKGENLLLIKGK